MKGHFERRELYILIDSGSAHNFLNKDTGHRLGCQHTPITIVKVAAANGSSLVCESQCKNFQWLMQDQDYVVDVFLIELDTSNMVLGIQWLSELGDITWNFNNLKIKYDYQGRGCVLKEMAREEVQLVDKKWKKDK